MVKAIEPLASPGLCGPAVCYFWTRDSAEPGGSVELASLPCTWE